MDKKQLKTKVDALQANLDVRKSELTTAQVELNVALNELADAGKPVISCDLAGDLMDQIEEMFSETLLNLCASDLDVEFGIGYDNRIELENVDMSNVGFCRHDLEAVFEVFFAIQDDEESDNS